MHLLRSCATPTMHYVSRVLPPPITHDGLMSFDARIADTVRKKLQLRNALTPEQLQSLHLPIRTGGVGITSRAAISNIAFYSCAAASLPFTQQVLTVLVTPAASVPAAVATAELAAATAKAAAAAAAAATEVQRRFEATVHFNNIAAAHHHVTTQNACAGVAELPRVMRGDGCNNGFWDTHHADACPKLQHQLTGHYHDTLVRQLAASSTSFRTRIASCRTRMASLWLSSRIGECGGRHLSNAHAVCALRQRIGAPPVDQLPSKCTCNTSLTSAEEQYGHVHWCSKLKAASTALRHNIVVDAINNACRNAGVSTRVEVVQPSFSVVLNRNRSLRPDLLLYGTNNTLFVDIAVCHPLAPSHIKKHAPRDSDDRRLRSIEYIEQSKATKYKALAALHNATFMPFV
jgi:hypothetical protein